MEKFDDLSFVISERVTKEYSTSFYAASQLFDKEVRDGIFSIYGFVRFADEIVDTFHDYDKNYLLDKFESDCYDALTHGISLNPVLNSFQKTVKKYEIPRKLVEYFVASMRKDLNKKVYLTRTESDEYIYGSADVVGLMCLKVFCKGDNHLFRELEKPAMKLGSAFQKVNFLRDLRNDTELLGRQYFHQINGHGFDHTAKEEIIAEIEADFKEALQGLRKLPGNSRTAVYIAYSYYTALLKKIKSASIHDILSERIRISDRTKLFLMLKSILFTKLNVIQ
jgi:phytoene/squalene synthetase